VNAPPVGVLFVTAAGERGGAETVLRALLRHVDRARVRPVVCCLRPGPFETELRQLAGVEVVAIQVRGLRHAADAWRAVRGLRAAIRERHVALVHANGTGAHLYAGPAARLEGVPAIFHVHDQLKAGWSGQGLVNALVRRVPAAVHVTPSRFLAGRLGRSTRTPAVVIPNGVEEPVSGVTASVTPGDAAVRTVVWCGRLQRWKGAHVFLHAAVRVHESRPATRFAVVGGTLFGLDREYADELRAFVRRRALDDAVRFTGHLADPWPELARADLVVHSAIRPEPFGLVIVEAMLAGKPVVAAAGGGPAEIVDPGVTGLLVTPGDADALAGALLALLTDDQRRAEMGRAGRARARTLFGAETMARRFEALYAELAGTAIPTVERQGVV
jgi:glycosyltransferase involved in cell wall biosynthesis